MLLLLAFRYNLLFVYKSTSHFEGVLFPAAWNQIFTGIYILELCATGLFLLVRREDNAFGCVGQAVISIIITILTVIFQLLLNQIIQPVKRYNAITVGDDTEMDADGNQDTVRNKVLAHSTSNFVSLGLVDCDIDSKLVERRATVTYEHQSLLAQTPVIWIPKDNYGVSEDEVRVFRETDSSLEISNAYACLGKNNRILVTDDF